MPTADRNNAFVSPFTDRAPFSVYSSLTILGGKRSACLTCALLGLTRGSIDEYLQQLSEGSAAKKSTFQQGPPSFSASLPPPLPQDPNQPSQPVPPPPLANYQFHVYLCGGITIAPDGIHFYLVSATPELRSIVGGPPFTVNYTNKIPFAGGSYSSIEILVYEGPIADGKKVAYGNVFANGSQSGSTISLASLGCHDSSPGGPWNYNCSGIIPP